MSNTSGCGVPIVVLRTDKGDLVDLVFPQHVTRYHVATLARVALGGAITVTRVGGKSVPPAVFPADATGVLLVPPEWFSEQCRADMMRRAFMIEAVGSAVALPEDPNKRSQQAGQAEAAKKRLMKELKDKVAEAVANPQSVAPAAAAAPAAASTRPAAPSQAKAAVGTSSSEPVLRRVADTPSPPPQSHTCVAAGDPERDEMRHCPHCNTEVHAQSFAMHTLACQRARHRCVDCTEVFTTSGALDAHRQQFHVLKPCPNTGCTERHAQPNLAAHLAQCSYRMSSCPDCGAKVLVRDVQQHTIRDCARARVPCTNRGCTESIPRELMAAHRDKCGYAVMQCAFCDSQLARREMVEHEQQCGSKTDVCAQCQRRIPRSGMALHRATCGRPAATHGCPNPGCTALVPVQDLENHRTTCPRLRQGCKLCGLVMARSEHAAHADESCPKAKVRCPNAGCSEWIERESLNKHASSSCPCRLVPCTYCGANFRAQDLQGHINACGGEMTACTRCRKPMTRSTVLIHSATCKHNDPAPGERISPPPDPRTAEAAPIRPAPSAGGRGGGGIAVPTTVAGGVRANPTRVVQPSYSTPSATTSGASSAASAAVIRPVATRGGALGVRAAPLRTVTDSGAAAGASRPSNALAPMGGAASRAVAQEPIGLAVAGRASLGTRVSPPPQGSAKPIAAVKQPVAAAGGRAPPIANVEPVPQASTVAASRLPSERAGAPAPARAAGAAAAREPIPTTEEIAALARRLQEEEDLLVAYKMQQEEEQAAGGRGGRPVPQGAPALLRRTSPPPTADDEYAGMQAMRMMDRQSTAEDLQMARQLEEAERRRACASDEEFARRLQQDPANLRGGTSFGGGGPGHNSDYSRRGGRNPQPRRSPVDDWDDADAPIRAPPPPATTGRGAGAVDPSRNDFYERFGAGGGGGGQRPAPSAAAAPTRNRVESERERQARLDEEYARQLQAQFEQEDQEW